MTPWKHDALAADLAEHLRGKSERLVWTDMQLGPAGSPRPDVYTVPFSFSRFQPLAYECKVSVSDFRADITKGKWSDYLRFASAVIFAVPEGLITKADLPPGCGLMVRGPNGWRTVKGPTMRALENLPRDAWVKLLIDGMMREFERRKPEQRTIWTESQRVRATLGEQVSEMMRDRHFAELSFAAATKKLRESAQDADKEYRERMEKARERANADASQIDRARRELAEALGLDPATASVYLICREANKVRKLIEKDEEVMMLRHQISAIESALKTTRADHPLFKKEQA